MSLPALFLTAGARRALAETAVVAGAGLLFLRLLSPDLPAALLRQALFALGPACTLYCAVRARLPEGRWGRQAVWELGMAAMLSVVLSATQLTLLSATIQEGVLTSSRGIDLFLVAVAMGLVGGVGAGYVAFRAGVRLWVFWDRLRRRHLLWALTHAHLMVVVAIALLFVFLLTLTAGWGGGSLVDSGSRGPASTLVRAVVMAIPYLGVMVVLTAIALVAVLPPSVALSYFFARRTTRRLEALAAAAAALRAGDLTARVPVTGEDEVGRLQADFNAMAADLEQAMRDLQAERDNVAALLQDRRQLLASVSHELRTPVATLRSYLESTVRRWDELQPATVRHDLEVMGRETVRLQRLIDDLFTLARAEVGALEMHPVAVDAGALARRVVETVAPVAWQTGRVELVAEVPGDPLPARADEARLEQILGNLLRNALRHTPPGGIVAVAVRVEPDAVAVEVRDTGEGIAPEELPHIWERFYRTRSSRARDGDGAGLGLALVKDLTEAMGGTVSASSAPGEGSRFTVRLPRA